MNICTCLSLEIRGIKNLKITFNSIRYMGTGNTFAYTIFIHHKLFFILAVINFSLNFQYFILFLCNQKLF